MEGVENIDENRYQQGLACGGESGIEEQIGITFHR